MSSNSQHVVVVATTSNGDNHLTQNRHNDTRLDHSRNDGSDKIEFLTQQQQQQQLIESATAIDQSLLSNMSRVTTTTKEITVSTSQPDLVQHRPQPQPHVVHYPTEFVQLGKRKFQNLDSTQWNVELQPTLQNFTFSDTNGPTIHNSLDNEAGLSLLFAASLLQQQQQQQQHQTHQDNNNIVDKAHASNNLPTTMNAVNWGQQQEQHQHHIQGSYQQNKTTSNTDEEKTHEPMVSIDEQVTCSMEDGHSIEPMANDVLCGRGGGINKHYGNIIYRRVVEYNKRVYKQVPKRHRMLVSRSIVHAIINAGGRFLQQQEEVENVVSNSASSNNSNSGSNVNDPKPTKRFRWTPIQIRRAVQKTSQALRERSCSCNNNDEDDNESISG